MAIYTGVKAEKYFTDSWFSNSPPPPSNIPQLLSFATDSEEYEPLSEEYVRMKNLYCRYDGVLHTQVEIIIIFCFFCLFFFKPMLLSQNTILQNITYNARLITLLYLQKNTYDVYNVGYSC